MRKLLHFVNPVYNVNVLPSDNGSVTASPLSGTYGTEVTLTNTPDEYYVFDKYELSGATLYDGNKFMIRKSDVTVHASFKTKIPIDLDFLYQAKDFDGTKIPNKAINPTFGDYLKIGTLTKNGTGSECYLSNGLSSSNYLYVDLTANQVTAMKALAGTTYTWFFRVENTTGVGGIMSTRWNGDGNMVNQIRSQNDYINLNLSTSSSAKLTDFKLLSTNVFKVRNSGTALYCKNLISGEEWNGTTTSTKAMGSRMRSFYGGSSTEAYLSAFYGLAGIPRDTTAEEDELMKTCLLYQNV